MIMYIHIFKVFPNEIKGNAPRGISPVPKVEHSIFKVKSRGHFIENLYIPHLSGAYMRLNHFHQNLDLHFYKIHASKGLYRNNDKSRSKESKPR